MSTIKDVFLLQESDIQIKGAKHVLYGHTRRITQIVICKPYSIFVSASEDKTCIIWDLNRQVKLQYQF